MVTESNSGGSESRVLVPTVCGFVDGETGEGSLYSRGNLILHETQPRDIDSILSSSRFSAGPGWWPECISFAASAQEVRAVACELRISMLPAFPSPCPWHPLGGGYHSPCYFCVQGISSVWHFYFLRTFWFPGQTSVSECWRQWTEVPQFTFRGFEKVGAARLSSINENRGWRDGSVGKSARYRA